MWWTTGISGEAETSNGVRRNANLPAYRYAAQGHHGQLIYVVTEKRLVIVSLSTPQTRARAEWALYWDYIRLAIESFRFFSPSSEVRSLRFNSVSTSCLVHPFIQSSKHTASNIAPLPMTVRRLLYRDARRRGDQKKAPGGHRPEPSHQRARAVPTGARCPDLAQWFTW